MADIGGGPEQQPGLLQMAGQGTQPQSYGTWAPYDFYDTLKSFAAGGGGGGGGSDGGGLGSSFGSGWDAQISPQDKARYFDASGEYKIDDPRQVAAEGGINLGQLAGGLMPRWKNQWQSYEYPSDKGGFFKIEDLYGLSGPPTLPQQGDPNQRGGASPERNPSHIDVPQAATYGMNRPSTNNWRLLGMGPGWIMRNGQMIDTQDISTKFGYPRGRMPTGGVTAEHYVPFAPLPLGGGTSTGVPNMVSPGGGTGWATGWPGALNWTKGGMIDLGLGS